MYTCHAYGWAHAPFRLSCYKKKLHVTANRMTKWSDCVAATSSILFPSLNAIFHQYLCTKVWKWSTRLELHHTGDGIKELHGIWFFKPKQSSFIVYPSDSSSIDRNVKWNNNIKRIHLMNRHLVLNKITHWLTDWCSRRPDSHVCRQTELRSFGADLIHRGPMADYHLLGDPTVCPIGQWYFPLIGSRLDFSR
jgi:hypothetical protein